MLERLGDHGDRSLAHLEEDVCDAPDHGLPKVILDYLPKDCTVLPWKKLGLGVSQIVLETKDKSATARLLKIPAGKSSSPQPQRQRVDGNLFGWV